MAFVLCSNTCCWHTYLCGTGGKYLVILLPNGIKNDGKTQIHKYVLGTEKSSCISKY